MSEHLLSFFRYCPVCGQQKIRFDEKKSIRCGQCGLIYYSNPAGAVAALIFDDKGRLLFTRRAHDPAKGSLDLPGGFIDPMENAEEALIREIREELGIELSKIKYAGSIDNRYQYAGVTYHTIDLIFLCKVENFDHMKAGDDITSFEFRNINETSPDEVGLESLRKVFIKLKSGAYSGMLSDFI
ncbi:MAG: NUDIX domain-containing protein [Bacteroidales bacterium]|jgi:mutator protein MutT|nr:NUDIX domain-containing protein [Bacteroidales bacterium]